MSASLPTTSVVTADELFRMPRDACRHELVDGELKKTTAAGYEHGAVTNEISGYLKKHVDLNKLGQVPAAETGFLIAHDPDTVRAPDVAFVRKQRIEAIGVPKEYFPEAPALAVEVVSPNDTVEEVDAKIRMWLAAGTELAWVVSPGARTVTVYRSADKIEVLTEKDTLTGDPVVPGFVCAIADIFAGL